MTRKPRANQDKLVADSAGPPSTNGASAGAKGDADAPTVSPRNTLNDLTAKEWLPETISVWTQRGLGASHPDAQIERQHPAPFSFTDVSRLVRFFTKRGDLVLDPFVGIGSTLKACAIEGRRGIGIELNPRYCDLSEERLRKEVDGNLLTENDQQVICGDARDALFEIPADSVDFVVTSPPYWNILHKEDHKTKQERISHGLDTRYSDDSRDLGNIDSYEKFLEELASIFQMCGTALKKNKHLCVVVSDFREKGTYRMFHADLANKLGDFGFVLKGVKILYQRHKRVFPYGYPAAYVPNIHHQYILVLRNEK
jgi:DNA modification methylase